MTFNIFHDGASERFSVAPWDTRRDLVVNTIEAASTDIVGLQEAYMWQVAWLEEQMPEYEHVGRGRDADGGGESVTVLFRSDRFTLEESGDFWLSPNPDDPGTRWSGMSFPRIVTWARLSFADGDRELYVYNTHLPADESGGAEARRLGAILLADRIAARSHPEVPFILLADLNTSEEEFPIRYLKREVRACAPGDCSDSDPYSPVAVVDTWRLLNEGAEGTRCRNDPSGAPIVHGERVDYVLVMDTTLAGGSAADQSTADGVLSSATLTPIPSCASDHVGVRSRFVVPSY
jgi:endonuclease/exonuclease/phosphatase family metal-dependent hydrolase